MVAEENTTNAFAEWAKDKTQEEVIAKFKDQLLLVLVDRMGGDVLLSVRERDERPVGKTLIVQNATQENPYFRLTVGRKQ